MKATAVIRRLVVACAFFSGLVATMPHSLPVSSALALCPTCTDTVTTLTSSTNPSFTSGAGSSVTLTATVTPLDGGTVNEGVVDFTSDGDTVTGCGSEVVSGGQTTCDTVIAPQGKYSIEADYSDGSSVPMFNSSTSPSLTQTVFEHTTVSGDRYCNPGAITIPKAGSSGAAPLGANSYPADVFVGPAGQRGVPSNGGTAPEAGDIEAVTLQILRLSFPSPESLGLMLSGPNGANYDFMSYAGGNTPVNDVNLNLEDSASTLMPTTLLFTGNFKPTSYGTGPDTWAPPAPSTFDSASPLGTSTFTSEFEGSSANGAWSLYAVARSAGLSGSMGSGWCLTFTMQPTVARAGDFRFVRHRAGITFRWRVATHAGIAGFEILAEPRSGKAHPLNHRLIPVHDRRNYAFTIRRRSPGPFRLEIVSTSGRILQ